MTRGVSNHIRKVRPVHILTTALGTASLYLLWAFVVLLLSPPPVTTSAPSNFEDALVLSVSGPTALDWTPDGRMLIGDKGGRVWVYQNEALVSTPALDLSSIMCTNGERALGGVAVHPNFAVNHYVYVYYTFQKFGTCNESATDGPVNRLSRFVLSDSNVVSRSSETVLFDTPPLYKDHHNGGDVFFAKDGNLYVTVGDGGTASLGWPQDPGRLLGKIVRLTDTGGIPADNPFTGPGTARCNVNGVPPSGSPSGTKCQEIFAQGLRNPFRFAFDPNAAGVRFFINDVGQHTWEEISVGQSGADYGWPVREGPCAKDSTTDCGDPPPGMTNPIYWYQHGPDGAAITGGAFVPNGLWPAEYDGSYLFADYVFGKIYQLKPDGTGSFTRTDFHDLPRLVHLRFGPYGTTQALYYTSREDGVVRRIAYTGSLNRAPVARMTANPTYGLLPLAVSFDGTGSSDPDGDPLTYSWDFENDGTADDTGATTSHTYDTAGTFTAKLTVRDGRGGENSTTIRIDAGDTPPSPSIESPAEGTLFASGQQFTLHGSALDPDDGPLADTALTWEVIQHHATHTHPFVDPTPGNDIQITIPEPEELAAVSNTYFEIRLTATDSKGLSNTVTRELRPHIVDLTFQSNPSGLGLTVNGEVFTTPVVIRSVENYDLEVNAPNQTDTSGNPWDFDSWSDGGLQAHTITTPATAATYTATFRPGTTPPTATPTGTATATNTPASGGQPLTLNPSADTFVSASRPGNYYGSAPTLEVDSSSYKEAFIRFDLNGASGRVISATLRLYVTDSSSSGGTVAHMSDSDWPELTTNYNNRPAIDGPTLSTLGSVSSGRWVEFNVTGATWTGNAVSFGIRSSSSNGVDYASRESSNKPQLVLQLGDGGTNPTSTPTPTPTPTQTGPTATPTSTPTPTPTQTGPTATPTPTSTPSSGTRTATFRATEDTFVDSSSPNTNYGSADEVDVDASPTQIAYLKFEVSGLTGTVQSARVRVYVTNPGDNGGSIAKTTTNWSESTMTYNAGRPAIDGPVLATLGAVNSRQYYEFNVDGSVTGNGTASYAITPNSRDGVDYGSSESTHPPELVITTSG